MKAPFPWFGGKSRVAGAVWDRLGPVKNYVEPFFGSGAVLLGRPAHYGPAIETVNDLDGYVANFWRALSANPEAVARHADWPENENELHARHSWLVRQKSDFVPRLEGDPEFYDAKIAGYWVYGIACWIGGEFCKGHGPWVSIDGKLIRSESAGQGVHRKRLQLGNPGQGVHRQLLHLGSHGQGVRRVLLHLGSHGQGVRRVLLHLGSHGRGVHQKTQADGGLYQWLDELSVRLRRVRVCCGDWARVMGPAVTFKNSGTTGPTGIFLAPPYSTDRDTLYSEESFTVARDVARWCRENGDNPLLRIALCGEESEHDLPDWQKFSWRRAGMAKNGKAKNAQGNERIWFSPHCLQETGQARLFE